MRLEEKGLMAPGDDHPPFSQEYTLRLCGERRRDSIKGTEGRITFVDRRPSDPGTLIGPGVSDPLGWERSTVDRECKIGWDGEGNRRERTSR